VKEPFVFYGVPTRAGDRGRTGDVQLGNPFADASKSWAAARISGTCLRCASPEMTPNALTNGHQNSHHVRPAEGLSMAERNPVDTLGAGPPPAPG